MFKKEVSDFKPTLHVSFISLEIFRFARKSLFIAFKWVTNKGSFALQSISNVLLEKSLGKLFNR